MEVIQATGTSWVKVLGKLKRRKRRSLQPKRDVVQQGVKNQTKRFLKRNVKMKRKVSTFTSFKLCVVLKCVVFKTLLLK